MEYRSHRDQLWLREQNHLFSQNTTSVNMTVLFLHVLTDCSVIVTPIYMFI